MTVQTGITTSRRDFAKNAGIAMGAAAGSLMLGGSLAQAAEDGGRGDAVSYLMDYNAICACQYSYALGIDMKKPELIAFDETIDVCYPATGTVLEGRSGPDFAKSLVDNMAARDIVTQHYMNVYELAIEGDAAHGLTYLRATHLMEGADIYIVGGYYENDYVRTPDGWKIKRVQLTYTYEEGETYF